MRFWELRGNSEGRFSGEEEGRRKVPFLQGKGYGILQDMKGLHRVTEEHEL